MATMVTTILNIMGENTSLIEDGIHGHFCFKHCGRKYKFNASLIKFESHLSNLFSNGSIALTRIYVGLCQLQCHLPIRDYWHLIGVDIISKIKH